MSKSVTEIVDYCQGLFDDLDFTAAREWKAADPSRKVIGYMPVYVPREIIHAAGMLPLGILGGGESMEVIHGDAYYQSYICRIPRSTIELAITKKIDFVDGMLFPSICDVIRNLSGMWKLMFPDVYARYFDVPQNYLDEVGGNYYVQELRELMEGLEELGGRKITDDDLRRSIAVYNENRRLVEEVYDFRTKQPWKAPSWEVYLVMRAGMVLPVEDHTQLMQDYLAAAKYEPDGTRKGQYLVDAVRDRAAEGVIFAAPSFCDPALLDRPMLANALSKQDIPHISFKYAENSGQMQPIREQAGTFADTIKLWS